jgi:hypothetical protein
VLKRSSEKQSSLKRVGKTKKRLVRELKEMRNIIANKEKSVSVNVKKKT